MVGDPSTKDPVALPPVCSTVSLWIIAAASKHRREMFNLLFL